MKSDSDILFELPYLHRPLGHYGQMQEWIRITMITCNARLKQLNFILDWVLESLDFLAIYNVKIALLLGVWE
jgi:hypothetical protein